MAANANGESLRPKLAIASRRGSGALAETLWLGVVGVLFALAANALSPRGLALHRDYFPTSAPDAKPTAPPTSRTAAAAPAPTTPTNAPPSPSSSSQDRLLERLRAQDLQAADSNLVATLFKDIRYEQELFVFIDARNEQEYGKGHVPGAYLFDRYRAENYLGTVLPVCQTADRVVVYCNGGDCEDSEFTAITLRQAGIPGERLWVYAGGLGEWITNGMPVEAGERKSGQIVPARK